MLANPADVEKDSKTALLHYCQRHRLGQPRYDLVETTGLQHEQEFRVVARLDAEGCARYVVTDVNKDGMLQGPNLELLRSVCAAMYASGVIASEP